MKKKIQTMTPTDSIKLSFTAMASGAIWFYAGPVASIASRAFFTFAYDFLYGIPNWYNPSYGLAYMPIREHVAHYAFEYGGLMLGSICAPFVYKGINAASDIGEKLFTSLGLIAPEKQKSLKEAIAPIPALRFSKQNHRISEIKKIEQEMKELKKLERLTQSAPNSSRY